MLEQDALEKFPDKIVVTGMKQSHVEIKEGSTGWKGVKGASDGFMRTVAESYIFAGTREVSLYLTYNLKVVTDGVMILVYRH